MQRRLLRRVLAAGLLAVGTAAVPVAGAATTHACSTRLSQRIADLAHRHAAVTLAVAVRDLTGAVTYGYRRHGRERSASIVKVEVLETLLHRHPHGLSATLSARAARMIEHSNNTDAERLYELVGGAAGLRAFGDLAGLHDTAPAAATGPGYAWGLTLTSPADQLRLLDLLMHHNAVLTDTNRRYVLRLMTHVQAGQRWGVTSGVGRSRVALKDGWLPLRNGSTDWQINSIGSVHGSTRHYLIAVESRGADTMPQGVALVEQVSRLVARACG